MMFLLSIGDVSGQVPKRTKPKPKTFNLEKERLVRDNIINIFHDIDLCNKQEQELRA
jgi:hypothetical protein